MKIQPTFAEQKRSYGKLKACDGCPVVNDRQVCAQLKKVMADFRAAFGKWQSGAKHAADDCFSFVSEAAIETELRKAFYRFVLDQRLATGRTLHAWLKQLTRKPLAELCLEDVFEFADSRMATLFLAGDFRTLFAAGAAVDSRSAEVNCQMLGALLFDCLFGGAVHALRDVLRMAAQSERVQKEFGFLKARVLKSSKKDFRHGGDRMAVFVAAIEKLAPEIAVDNEYETLARCVVLSPTHSARRPKYR